LDAQKLFFSVSTATAGLSRRFLRAGEQLRASSSSK